MTSMLSTPPERTPLGQRWMYAALTLLVIYGLGALLEALVIEYVQRIILLVGINVILAVGLNLINGTAGQFSIGHAGFMAIGAYGAAFVGVHAQPLIQGIGAGGAWTNAIVLNVALLSAAALAGSAGFLIGVPSLRLRGDYLAVVTLGFGEIIRISFTNAEFLGGATGYFGNEPTGLPSYSSFFWVFVWAAVIVATIYNLTFSPTGRALVAIREDEIAAEAMATPTTRLKVQAFVVSAATAGIAGGLFAYMQAGIRPEDFRLEKSIDMIVMVIIGGLGSISGAIIGAFFVSVTLELMRDLAEYRLVIYALLLVVIMIVRPKGLLGTREVSEIFKRPGRLAKRARS